MTEDEVQKLEQEEIQQQEEELKKKKGRNILEDLDQRLEAVSDIVYSMMN